MPGAGCIVGLSAGWSKVAAIYFDDIEKFGIWPETYHWVYEKGWLERFIQSVLASKKIRTQHYSEYHASEKTRGIIYLPTVSYIEMNEWTLPAQSANTYADLVQQAKTSGWIKMSQYLSKLRAIDVGNKVRSDIL